MFLTFIPRTHTAKGEEQTHIRLICDFLKKKYPSTQSSVSWYNEGHNKAVYKIHLDSGSELLAAAASHDCRQSLHEEYAKLCDLYMGVPSLFPKPVEFYSVFDVVPTDFIFMEFLPQPSINEVGNLSFYVSDGFRKLAQSLGVATGKVFAKTGYIPTELHDKNVLVSKKDDDFSLKLCDAAHYVKGSIDDCFSYVFTNRPDDCARFKQRYSQGFCEGLIESGYNTDLAQQSTAQTLDKFL
jgi:hypothetical protein